MKFVSYKDMARNSFVHMSIIAIVALLSYSNTFNVPFQWDDKELIGNNPVIKDLSNFLSPSNAKSYSEYGLLIRRYLSFLTFALNYKLHGIEYWGYHLFNISIHIFNALLVYKIIRFTFKTPFLKSSRLSGISAQIAFFGGLFFVTHPIQIEAVTYIMQRFASLSAFFYLTALTSYIKWRLDNYLEENTAQPVRFYANKRHLYFVLSIFSAVLAVKTKENTITLPITITFYEFLFLSGAPKARLMKIIPFYIILLIIPLSMSSINLFLGNIAKGTSAISDNNQGSIFDVDYLYPQISRLEYFTTQIRVIVTYLRLLFLPINQNLLYDYPKYASFLNPQIIFSLILLLLMIGVAIFFYYLSKSKSSDLRLISFGILWFFITLSVESSFIPIPLFIAEYRLYLPGIGIFIVSIVSGSLLYDRIKSKTLKITVGMLPVILSLLLGAATYSRNHVWRNEISLWEDVVRKSPNKAKAHNNLGIAYKDNAMLDKAIEQYMIAINIEPTNVKALNNLGVAYYLKGQNHKAIEFYKTALNYYESVDIHYNLATIYTELGQYNDALNHYVAVLRLKPDSAEAYYNVGTIYDTKGMIYAAIRYYENAINIKPDYVKAHVNLGIAYKNNGLTEKAIEHYLIALSLRADIPEIYNNLGNAYKEKGQTEQAINYYLKAIGLNPDYTNAHFNLALAYLERGLKSKALEEFVSVLRITPDNIEARRHVNLLKESIK